MKKITRIVLICAFSLFTGGLYAQFGIQAGYTYNVSNGNLTLGDLNEFSGAFRSSGFQGGLTYDFTVKGEFSIQTALLYSFMGGKTKQQQRTIRDIYGTQTTTSTYHFIDLPIRAAYSLPVTNDFKFFFFGGPVLSYGFSAEVKEWEISGKYQNGTSAIFTSGGYDIYSKFDGKISPFDLKIGGGLGVLYNHFRVRAGYDFGLLNLSTGSRKNNAGAVNKIKRGQLSVSVGYVF